MIGAHYIDILILNAVEKEREREGESWDTKKLAERLKVKKQK